MNEDSAKAFDALLQIARHHQIEDTARNHTPYWGGLRVEGAMDLLQFISVELANEARGCFAAHVSCRCGAWPLIRW